VRSGNWLLVIAIALFCLLFFGGLWWLRRNTDWDRIRSQSISILLPLSIAISGIGGVLVSKTGVQALTKPWFSARNVPTPLLADFHYHADGVVSVGNLLVFESIDLGIANSSGDPKPRNECLFGDSH